MLWLPLVKDDVGVREDAKASFDAIWICFKGDSWQISIFVCLPSNSWVAEISQAICVFCFLEGDGGFGKWISLELVVRGRGTVRPLQAFDRPQKVCVVV